MMKRLLLLGLVLLAGSAAAGPVEDCQPCSVEISEEAGSVELFFRIATGRGGERYVESVEVRGPGDRSQQLTVRMEPKRGCSRGMMIRLASICGSLATSS